jgi:hypothetical protein
VRYGAGTLALVKGKNAIEVASAAQLVPTLELLKTAGDGGEMDAALKRLALGCARALASSLYFIQLTTHYLLGIFIKIDPKRVKANNS